MHELSITESVLEIALRHAREAGAARITDLYLVIGELSSVVDESVQFYWDFVSEGTAAEGAQLHFRRIPATLRCQDCGHTYGLSENLTCPSCDGNRIRVVTGQEFTLESIEVSNDGRETGAAGTGKGRPAAGQAGKPGRSGMA